jgi:ABC-type branched-subunit amino acid transport system permease subunit
MTSTAEKYRPLWLAALAVIALPFGLYLLGLSLNTGTMVVALAIAAMGLNLCIGYTGLVSFGHGAWFGIGAYAAGLIQRNWFGGDIFLPLLLAAVVVAVIATFVGFVILRRRGVYFSLLTLALSALAYTIAFRWTAVTGGEDGLGGLKRGSIGPFSLDNALNYYIVVSVLCLGVLYLLLRLVRSPFGHVLMAIRENQLRATFQGYPVERYKLGVFVISAVVTGFAGGLIGFQNYLVSAEAVSVPFSGELLAIVVIGGMRSMLGPAIGALFFILFRELFSIWTSNWLLWFGLVFVAFVLYSPGGLVGIWATLAKRWWPPENLRGPAAAGLPAAERARRHCARRARRLEDFWRHSRGNRCEPAGRRRRNSRIDRTERRGKNHAVQSGLRPLSNRQRHHQAERPRDSGRAVGGDLPPGSGALVPDHQSVQGAVDLRKPPPVAAGAERRAFQPLARHRPLQEYSRRDRGAYKIPRPRRHRNHRGW